MRKIIIISLALNIMSFTGAGLFLHAKGTPWIAAKWSRMIHPSVACSPRNVREDIFQHLAITTHDTVIVGDSLVNLGEWSELMNDPHVKNRGISGDTTTDVLARLDTITRGHPNTIVLMVGINNFQSGYSVERSVSEYRQIINRIKTESPNTRIIAIRVLPVNPTLYRQYISSDHPEIMPPDQNQIEKFLNRIWMTAKPVPCPLYNLPGLLTQQGYLDERYTFDGLHLNGAGLRIVADTIKKAM